MKSFFWSQCCWLHMTSTSVWNRKYFKQVNKWSETNEWTQFEKTFRSYINSSPDFPAFSLLYLFITFTVVWRSWGVISWASCHEMLPPLYTAISIKLFSSVSASRRSLLISSSICSGDPFAKKPWKNLQGQNQCPFRIRFHILHIAFWLVCLRQFLQY